MLSSTELLYLIWILPHVQLSLGLSDGSVSLRQAVGSLRRVRVVRRDLRPLREQVVTAVVQPVIRVGADHVGGAAVRVIGGVALLAVRHRQVLRAEGRHRLALGDAGRTPGGGKEMIDHVKKQKKCLTATGEEFSQRLRRSRELTAFVATPPRCQLPPPLLPMTLHVSAVAKHRKKFSLKCAVRPEALHTFKEPPPPPSPI